MKIAIIGYSGSGKSTLARKLGTILQSEVLHFDTVQFLPGWEIRTEEEKKKITKEFLDTHDSWVIDGNYSKLFHERRMAEADIIIITLFNRFSCLYRVVRRYLQYKGTTRPDMSVGCNEKLDWEFIKWILYEQRTKQAKNRYAQVRSQYREKVIVVKNQRQLDNCLKKLSRSIGI
ncbi:MAG: DNA topology modulation protein [Clostridia bacterium]